MLRSVQKHPFTSTVILLNRLLSNYKVYFHKLLRYQWLVQASKRPDLNEDLHRYAEEAEERIDELVSDIERLGGIPTGTWSRWQSHADIQFRNPVRGASNILHKVLEDTQQLHRTAAVLQKQAQRAHQAHTEAFAEDINQRLSERLEELEQTVELLQVATA